MKDNFLTERLYDIFGYKRFRGNQLAIINNLLGKKNGLVIMPTGSGKSLCYQLPAIVQKGCAIIISPLIALMKDQVDFLKNKGINASFLNSTLSKKSVLKMKEDVVNEKTKLLYIAPESFNKLETIEFLKNVKISFLAIDETHCISDWGHDFRPEYRKIRSSMNLLGNIPIIALTATATLRVQNDIINNLDIKDGGLFKSSFDRTNLYYSVKPKYDAEKEIIKYVKKNKGKSGIIYCHSRKTVEKLSELLNINDVKSAPYHAGLDTNSRINNQENFLHEKIDVIVATIAFGMGIDKPDVRFVIHFDTPKSLEGYYQETGRAGRDNKPSECILFYSNKDAEKLKKFNKDKPISEKVNAKILLNEVTKYATCTLCRRKQLLFYFGEEYQGECNNCDNCKFPAKTFEGGKHIKIVLNTLKNLNKFFDEEYISKIIVGDLTSKIQIHQHDKLKVFGSGKNHGDIFFWQTIIHQLLIFGFVSRNKNYELLITEKGENFIQNTSNHYLVQNKFNEYFNKNDYENELKQREENIYDKTLYKSLISLRDKIAEKNKIMPYLVFSDSTLEDLAIFYPTTIERLSRISNIGSSKAKKFGIDFIKLIKKYVDGNNIEPITQILTRPEKKNQKESLYIIKQIDKKVSLEEIASSKSLEVDELLSKIEQICFSGVKLDLNYYIDKLIEKERQQEVFDYFKEAQTDDINKALADLEDEYNESEVRLMHIKFISEVAN